MTGTQGSIDAGVGIGEIFIEKYRVDAILGHGGMGVVALCTHLALNEQVAIKMLRRDVLDDADAVERFMREAQAAVKLKSEFVARVSDVGRSETNVPYMVMEYLEGHDLGELLDERGSIALPWAVEITLQACEALCEAHSIGIVHRDVKPTNLFVTWRPDGSALIKVLDFGISKSPIISAMQLTQTQSMLGTPAYMSPEQMRSARMVDARTDIWSLGTVLYELLEGRRPFEAQSFSEMCVKVAVDPPGPMTNTPLALQQVVLRCLEKAPEQRYGSMAELAADLVQFSHDPHQAQVLVERMSRMLRRSQIIDWDPARNSKPMPARSGELKAQARSGELKAQGHSAELKAEVHGAELKAEVAAGSDPVLPRTRVRATSEPAPSAILDAQRRKRRSAILVLAALVGAATIGAVISLASDPATDDSNLPAVDHADTTAPSQPISGANQLAAPAPPSTGNPQPAAPPGAPIAVESPSGTPARPVASGPQPAVGKPVDNQPATGPAIAQGSSDDATSPTKQAGSGADQNLVNQRAEASPATPKPDRLAPGSASPTDKDAAKRDKRDPAIKSNSAKHAPTCDASGNPFGESHGLPPCPK